MDHFSHASDLDRYQARTNKDAFRYHMRRLDVCTHTEACFINDPGHAGTVPSRLINLPVDRARVCIAKSEIEIAIERSDGDLYTGTRQGDRESNASF